MFFLSIPAKLSRSSVPRAALQLQGGLISGDGRPIQAPHHRCPALRNTRRRSATKAGEQNRLGPVERTCKDWLYSPILGGCRLSGATPWALFAGLARYRRKKIMMLLKRNLEGFRVHSYVAACTANLAPTIGLGRVPDLKPAPKGPVERVAGVFVGCGVCGVKNHFLATPHPSTKLKWPLNRATAARPAPSSPLFWPPSAGERAPP
jgi:hypothetical protein